MVVRFLLLFLAAYLLFFSVGLFLAYQLQQKKLITPPFAVIVAGLVTCTLGYGAFWIYLFNEKAGLTMSYLFMLASFAVLIFLARRRRYQKLLVPDVIFPLALVFFVGLFYTSTVFSCMQVNPAPAPAPNLNNQCHLSNITFDNLIPEYFATNVQENQERDRIGDWQGSDRPPLQTGITLLYAPLTNSGEEGGSTGYEIIAVLAQCLWIPAVWLLLRKLKLKSEQIGVVFIFCIFSGFFFFNSVFVWPKLLAGSLVLLATVLVLFEKNKRSGWILAALGAALGFLAHSSVIFTLIPLFIMALFKMRRGRNWPGLLAAGALFVVLCSPWVGYQRFYDPPGDRLLKWHVGGVEQIDARPFIETVHDSYADTSPHALLDNKLSNIRFPLGEIPPDGSLYDTGLLGKFRDAEFRYLVMGFGLLNISWLYFLLKSGRSNMRRKLNFPMLREVIILGLSSTFLWMITLFGPGVTAIHHGSYATWILLFSALAALLAVASKWLVRILLLVQIVYFLIVWIFSVWLDGRIALPMAVLSGVSFISILAVIYYLSAKKSILDAVYVR